VNPLLILATALLISGPAYVLDGNTVVVAGMHIRLKGADASELNTERGETARQVLIDIVGDSELTLPPDRIPRPRRADLLP
jgi:endonuclease YncB( thermonuclease family)